MGRLVNRKVTARNGTSLSRPRMLTDRLWLAADGVTAIETAILLPVFLTFLLGIFEFGRVLWIQSALQFAAESASRCAVINASSTCSSNSATQTYASGQVLGLSVPSGDFSVSSSGTCFAAGGNGGSKTVSASFPFSFILTQLFPYTITLTASSTRPC
jgi:Flp pilus assembly protein TadG